MSMASMSVSKTDGPGSSPGAPANLSEDVGVWLKNISGQGMDSKERAYRG